MIVEDLIMSESPIRLNIGCGTGKIEGFINIDIDESLQPDKVYDIRNELPFQPSMVDQIVMYHTIEHIPKCHWQEIFLDFSRVLKANSELWISYPEYTRVFEYWKTNHRGLREFWEACIFGRGHSAADRHCSISDTDEMIYYLSKSGFEVYYQGDDGESHNTLLKCKNRKAVLYENVLKEAVWQHGHQLENGLIGT
jgi:predicted SAM-dependent methyltransferase